MDKKVFYIAGTLGSLLGSYVPVVFGANPLGVTSIMCGGVAGLLAIVLAYRLQK